MLNRTAYVSTQTTPQWRRLAAVAAREIILLAAASVFLALTARISVPLPFTPVPVTGQTLGVLLTGALYGPWRGALALVVYLLEGLAGAPVFAGGASGLPILLGPRGGYLVGFIAAAAVAGWLGGASRPAWLRFAGMLLATAAIYAVGVPWLTVAAARPLPIAIVQGLLPFLAGDVLKAALAAGVVPAGTALLTRLSRWSGQ
ncbi:MAG: biotin transporter BioY [Chloroflexi bacterium]|nr:biotin transporter BioY [Chloroflexota bacterium]